MNRISVLLFLGCTSLFTGCVSGVMTASTGKDLAFPPGTSRVDVISALGAPMERRTDISAEARKRFSHRHEPVAFAEIFEYKGKINYSDEGSGEAMIGALTLGASEIIMIPATAVSIVKRSRATNHIYVFFDSSERVIDYIVNPQLEYQSSPSK